MTQPRPQPQPNRGNAWQASGRRRQQPSNNQALPAPPPPTVRLQNEDPTPPARQKLRMPSPEQLGVVSDSHNAPKKQLDWNDVRSRLRSLHAVGFHVNRLKNGSSRVTFMLPGQTRDRMRHVEATSPTETEAVLLALQEAERWMSE